MLHCSGKGIMDFHQLETVLAAVGAQLNAGVTSGNANRDAAAKAAWANARTAVKMAVRFNNLNAATAALSELELAVAMLA